ncbi:EI24 domain-containing protein [Stackebrandtia soli]|uniref:EI24 domain-containing protein n=1 Tax=Stackebrandtia soli TaxID=1892856 RepID=UPI0039E8EBFF
MREIVSGAGYLGRGFGFWGRRPKVMWLGAIPGLLASLLIGAALLLLAFNIADLAAWLTSFASDWAEGWRTFMRIVAGIAVFTVSVWLSIVMFTALTLLVGDPFYEAIAARVEEECGGAPTDDRGLLISIGHSVADSLRLLGKSLVTGLILFAFGMIPVAGPIIALVVGGLVGGWFLSVELVAYAFNRRGIRYREYRAILAKRRIRSVSFGTGVFLLFLIPLGAIIVMPAAVAGATMMARDILGEPTRPGVAPTAAAPSTV